MRLLVYKDLNLRRIKAAFDKVKAAIEAGDFRSADVKKLNAGPCYRAKLDYANRLLLQFARIDRPAAEGGLETVCLALEVIENHALRHAVGLPRSERARTARGAGLREPEAGGRLPQLPRAAGNAARAARPRSDAADVRRLVRTPSPDPAAAG